MVAIVRQVNMNKKKKKKQKRGRRKKELLHILPCVVLLKKCCVVLFCFVVVVFLRGLGVERNREKGISFNLLCTQRCYDRVMCNLINVTVYVVQ